MNTLSFTQEFFICSVNEKGKAPAIKKAEFLAGLISGGILELTLDGYVQIDGKGKYIPTKNLDEQKKVSQTAV